MPFLDHLEELRWRLIKSIAAVVVLSCASFPLTDILLNILTYPNTRLVNPAKLIFLKPTGMLMLRMEISIAAGIIVSLPVVIYQLWQFIAPGLVPKERRLVFPVIFITLFCFLLGSCFAYFVMIPLILPFLFSMGTKSIEATINVNEYMSFLLRIILLTGLIFELPVLAFFLARFGLITPAILRKGRRYAIVAIFILAAVVTPTPDPFNQTILAVPLFVLYEISIWVAAIAYRKKQDTAVKSKKELGRQKPAGNAKTRMKGKIK
jgi:sec-independent protein translocase protein TatC